MKTVVANRGIWQNTMLTRKLVLQTGLRLDLPTGDALRKELVIAGSDKLLPDNPAIVMSSESLINLFVKKTLLKIPVFCLAMTLFDDGDIKAHFGKTYRPLIPGNTMRFLKKGLVPRVSNMFKVRTELDGKSLVIGTFVKDPKMGWVPVKTSLQTQQFSPWVETYETKPDEGYLHRQNYSPLIQNEDGNND